MIEIRELKKVSTCSICKVVFIGFGRKQFLKPYGVEQSTPVAGKTSSYNTVGVAARVVVAMVIPLSLRVVSLVVASNAQEGT